MKTRTIGGQTGRSIAEYDEAIAKAGRWLRAQQRTDGSSGDGLSVWAYYTQPMALRAVGEPKAANRCLSFTKKEFLDAKGTLKVSRDGVEGIAYAPAWAVINSHMWERFEISYPIVDWIAPLQDKETGGFYSTFEEAKKKKGLLEYEATLVAGMALLSTGRVSQAEAVGRFLIKTHQSQPDLENRYYFMWDKKKGLVTDDYDEKLALFYVVDKRKERQGYFLFGLAIALLSRLYMATGNRKYLRLATEYFEYADSCAGTYSTALAHKLCWANALLFQATGEARFLAGAKRVGDYLIGIQTPDGRYHYREIVPKFEDQNQTANLDIVSQFTTWLAQARFFMKDE
jgi:hypothetical protein